MATHIDDVLEMLSELAQVKEMKAAFQHSMRGAAWAGPTAVIGGLFGGPVGIFCGAALGGLIGAWMTYGQFKPVPQILSELPHNKRKELYEAVLGHIRHLDWKDARQLIALVMKNTDLREKLIGLLSNYLHRSLGAKIKCGR